MTYDQEGDSMITRYMTRRKGVWMYTVSEPGRWSVTGTGATPTKAVERCLWLVAHRADREVCQ